MEKFALLCSLWVILAWCSTQTPTVNNSLTGNQTIESWTTTYHQLSWITYSNISDEVSQQEVRQALSSADIDEKTIEDFFRAVDLFNTSIHNHGLSSWFTYNKDANFEYDSSSIPTVQEKNNPDFLWYNCRITSYSLLKNFIRIKNPVDSLNLENLSFDTLSLKARPILTDEEVKIFENFFARIPTTTTATQSENIEKAKENWIKKGVEFINTKASLISVFFHDTIDPESSNLFIGHIGVLVPTSDSQLLFIEKLAFDQPYQAIKFRNRSELNSYLMGKYDVDYSGESSRPFIFENGELMSGYALNPEITQKVKENLEFQNTVE